MIETFRRKTFWGGAIIDLGLHCTNHPFEKKKKLALKGGGVKKYIPNWFSVFPGVILHLWAIRQRIVHPHLGIYNNMQEEQELS